MKRSGFIFKSLLEALGIYLGIFLAHILQLILEARQSVSIMGTYVTIYEMYDYTPFFQSLVSEYLELSDKLIVSLFITILSFAWLVIFFYYTEQRINKTRLIIIPFTLMISVWFIQPLLIIISSIHPPSFRLTIESSIPASELQNLYNSISALDHFRFFARSFISSVKTILSHTVLFSIGSYHISSNNKENKESYVMIVLFIIAIVGIYLLNMYVFNYSSITYGGGDRPIYITPSLGEGVWPPSIFEVINDVQNYLSLSAILLWLILLVLPEVIKKKSVQKRIENYL